MHPSNIYSNAGIGHYFNDLRKRMLNVSPILWTSIFGIFCTAPVRGSYDTLHGRSPSYTASLHSWWYCHSIMLSFFLFAPQAVPLDCPCGGGVGGLALFCRPCVLFGRVKEPSRPSFVWRTLLESRVIVMCVWAGPRSSGQDTLGSLPLISGAVRILLEVVPRISAEILSTLHLCKHGLGLPDMAS